MPDEPLIAIAQIPLARSRTRLLLGPLLVLLAGLAAVAGGLVLSGTAGIAVAVLGVAVAVAGIYLWAVVESVRLDVEVSTLRLRWLGVDRRYQLVPGPVTRVALHGDGAARLQARFGAFGWGLGPARLRGEETIQLVRLARSASLILIPTDSGRVAVAPRSEKQLVEALSAAARVQQRLDQVTARARRPEPQPEPAPVQMPPIREAPPIAAPGGRLLTGIERQLLEERLAAERAAALAAAEAERRAAEEAARAAAAAPPPTPEATPAPARTRVARRRATRLARPALRLPALGGVPRPRLAQYVVALVPVVAALGLWVVAQLSGWLDVAPAQRDQVGVALALGGPIAALAALAVRAWFPRLLPLVTLTALCALVLVGRALVV